MAKFHSGFYTPENPNKLLNQKRIIFRSGWELKVMSFFDKNPNILHWASESVAIPYQCPFTGKKKNYIPDFFVIYKDKDGNKKAEIVEVKPMGQTGQTRSKSPANKAAAILNAAKWESAAKYCLQNGFTFKILTEADIFHTGNK